MSHRDGACHEYAKKIYVERNSPAEQRIIPDADSIKAETLLDLVHWLIRLESEYEYQISGEVVDDAIIPNDYIFTEPGQCFSGN